MSGFEWDRTEELLLPQDDGTAFRLVCNLLGNGNKAVGRVVLRTILEHVRHADTAHPWGDDVPARSQYRIADDEWAEFREQYYLAREHGLGDRDAPLCDEAALDEHRQHMMYEAGDLIAVLVKILRAN